MVQSKGRDTQFSSRSSPLYTSHSLLPRSILNYIPPTCQPTWIGSSPSEQKSESCSPHSPLLTSLMLYLAAVLTTYHRCFIFHISLHPLAIATLQKKNGSCHCTLDPIIILIINDTSKIWLNITGSDLFFVNFIICLWRLPLRSSTSKLVLSFWFRPSYLWVWSSVSGIEFWIWSLSLT